MAHRTRIGGTAYTVSGGKAMVNGTAYTISGGKVLVNGTAYSISFGEKVQITVTGTGKGNQSSLVIGGTTVTAAGVYEVNVGSTIVCKAGTSALSGTISLNHNTVASSVNASYTYTVTEPASIALGRRSVQIVESSLVQISITGERYDETMYCTVTYNGQEMERGGFYARIGETLTVEADAIYLNGISVGNVQSYTYTIIADTTISQYEFGTCIIDARAALCTITVTGTGDSSIENTCTVAIGGSLCYQPVTLTKTGGTILSCNVKSSARRNAFIYVNGEVVASAESGGTAQYEMFIGQNMQIDLKATGTKSDGEINITY